MLVPGGHYQYVEMHAGSTATGDGVSMLPTTQAAGTLPLLTAQVVGISGDEITWEGTINKTDWVALPALNLTTQDVANTATTAGLYRLIVTGLMEVRARISSYASGTIYVYGVLTASGEVGFYATSAGGGESTGPVTVTPSAASVASSAAGPTVILGSITITLDAASAASSATGPTVTITGQSLDFSEAPNSMYLGIF